MSIAYMTTVALNKEMAGSATDFYTTIEQWRAEEANRSVYELFGPEIAVAFHLFIEAILKTEEEKQEAQNAFESVTKIVPGITQSEVWMVEK